MRNKRKTRTVIHSTIIGNNKFELYSVPEFWTVYYEGKPFMVRKSPAYYDGRTKTGAITYNSKGYATRRARNLNKMFGVTGFVAVRIEEVK